MHMSLTCSMNLQFVVTAVLLSLLLQSLLICATSTMNKAISMGTASGNIWRRYSYRTVSNTEVGIDQRSVDQDYLQRYRALDLFGAPQTIDQAQDRRNCITCPGSIRKINEATDVPSITPTLRLSQQPSAQTSSQPSEVLVDKAPLAKKTTKTEKPTSEPTIYPSYTPTKQNPSNLPLMIPTSSPSAKDSLVSVQPTQKATLWPSSHDLNNDTSENTNSSGSNEYISDIPSVFPTITHENRTNVATDLPEHVAISKQTMRVKVLLNGITSVMSSSEEVAAIEEMTKEFLQREEDAGNWGSLLDIDMVKLTSQALVRESLALDENSVKLKSIESIRGLQDKQVPQDEELALEMNFEIHLTLHAQSHNHSIHDVVSFWDHNFDSYENALRSSPTLAVTFKRQDIWVDDNTMDEKDEARENRRQNGSNWTLLHTSLVVALGAFAFVAAFYFTRMWRHGVGSVRYKRQMNERGSFVLDTTSSSSSISPPVAETHSKCNKSCDDGSEEAPSSVCSRWNNWESNTRNDVISEESDSGWNSGSAGSISVAQSQFQTPVIGMSCSSLNILEPYSQEDVWSVAPDYHLCRSMSRSVCSVGAVEMTAGKSIDSVVTVRTTY